MPTAYVSMIKLSDGTHVCYALERLVDDKGIPTGIYGIEITYSPRFKRYLPWINVPKRTGIRIHPGNKIEQSIGCVLPASYIHLYATHAVGAYSDKKVVQIMQLIKTHDIKQIEFVDNSIWV